MAGDQDDVLKKFVSSGKANKIDGHKRTFFCKRQAFYGMEPKKKSSGFSEAFCLCCLFVKLQLKNIGLELLHAHSQNWCNTSV